eukprot:TCONS_00020447-protein
MFSRLKRCSKYFIISCFGLSILTSTIQIYKFKSQTHGLLQYLADDPHKIDSEAEKAVFDQFHWSKQMQICRDRLSWKDRNTVKEERTNVKFSIIEVSINESNQNIHGKVTIQTVD